MKLESASKLNLKYFTQMKNKPRVKTYEGIPQKFDGMSRAERREIDRLIKKPNYKKRFN